MSKIFNPDRWINILVYRFFYCAFQILYTVVFRRTVYGRENIPKKGGCILASNHASFLDPPIVGTLTWREAYYFARSSLMPTRFTQIFFKLLNCIPVDRENPTVATLKTAINYLKMGRALLVFPEGTRTETGELQEGKMGIGFIAHKAQVPIIPVYVQGSYDILPKGSKIPRLKKLIVKVGTPLKFEELYHTKGSEQVYQAISCHVMESIRHLKTTINTP